MNEENQEGAILDRQVEMPKDVEQEELKLLVKTGLTQGISKEQFRDLLDLLEVRFVVKPPVYVPGAPRGWNAYHGGQADVVKYLKYSCGELKHR